MEDPTSESEYEEAFNEGEETEGQAEAVQDDNPVEETKEEEAEEGIPRIQTTDFESLENTIRNSEKVVIDFKAKKAEFKKQYNSGDISEEQYDQYVDKIDDEIEKTKDAAKEAKYQILYEQKYQVKQWESELNNFLEENQDAYKNRYLYAALREAVASLNKQDKDRKLTDKQILKKAHDEVMGAFESVKTKQADRFKKANDLHKGTVKSKQQPDRKMPKSDDYHAAFAEATRDKNTGR